MRCSHGPGAKLFTSLPAGERRGVLAGVTGHVAESVTELRFDGWGHSMLWHFEGPGRHGIDLLALDPAGERVLAIEVKGTLRSRRWPRLSRRTLTQMSADWVDKHDNSGMQNWELVSENVYGAVVLINFADRLFRVGMTADFQDARTDDRRRPADQPLVA